MKEGRRKFNKHWGRGKSIKDKWHFSEWVFCVVVFVLWSSKVYLVHPIRKCIYNKFMILLIYCNWNCNQNMLAWNLVESINNIVKSSLRLIERIWYFRKLLFKIFSERKLFRGWLLLFFLSHPSFLPVYLSYPQILF